MGSTDRRSITGTSRRGPDKVGTIGVGAPICDPNEVRGRALRSPRDPEPHGAKPAPNSGSVPERSRLDGGASAALELRAWNRWKINLPEKIAAQGGRGIQRPPPRRSPTKTAGVRRRVPPRIGPHFHHPAAGPPFNRGARACGRAGALRAARYDEVGDPPPWLPHREGGRHLF